MLADLGRLCYVGHVVVSAILDILPHLLVDLTLLLETKLGITPYGGRFYRHWVGLASWQTFTFFADQADCLSTSFQRLLTDKRLPCASGGSAGGVNSSTDTSLVESR